MTDQPDWLAAERARHPEPFTDDEIRRAEKMLTNAHLTWWDWELTDRVHLAALTEPPDPKHAPPKWSEVSKRGEFDGPIPF
jgi:hypothetical protein